MPNSKTKPIVKRAGALATAVLVVAGLLTFAFGGRAGADDGDSFPPPPPGHTDPNVTKHATTFDNIAPAAGEFDTLPFGEQYVPGDTTTCTSPGTGYVDPQWRLVGGFDNVTTVEGQVTSSKIAWDDNPIDHHSRDRNFFIAPDPLFARRLAAPGNFHQGEDNEHGRIEVEWESAAFPAWALPMAGDRVHVEGSHIWDCAHGEDGYRTEIHPPRLVMALRDAANHGWPSDDSPTIPARPGWADTMPGLGSVPIPVTRADVFASSDGGEAREQETCFGAIPCPFGLDYYQPLKFKNYDLFIPAPPKPDPDAQLVTKIIHHPFLAASSDNDSGSLDVYGANPDPDPNRFTITQVPAGVNIHVNFDNFTEPASHLYGFGFTFEVGWNRVAPVVPHRVKVTIEGVHVSNPMDGRICIGCGFRDGEFEISSLIGDTFRHMVLTGNGVTYNSSWDVPNTDDVNVGDYGVRTDTAPGSKCALVADSGADPGPCQTQFDVTLLPGQPLRVFFRAEEQDSLASNEEAGSVELLATEDQNYGIGEHTDWFQERTSAGDDALAPECASPEPTPCLNITYKIEDDPIPGPAQTTLSTGSPTVVEGGSTWLTAASNLALQATAPSGHEGDSLDIHAHFWRSGTPVPAESVCGSGTGTASCTLHLNANDAQDGQYTVEYWAVDTDTGAIEPPQTKMFELDNTAPTTVASLGGTLVRGWYNTPVTVTLSAGDAPGVGVDHTSYRADGGFLLIPYSGPFVVGADSASHTVQFSSADKLGNTEFEKSTLFKIDKTPPVLEISNASDGTFSYSQNELLGGIFTNATSLSLAHLAVDGLSGIYQVRLDGAVITSSPATLAVPAGISTHSLVAEDVAGNLTTLTFSVVSVVPVAPGAADPQGAGFWKNYAAADLGSLLSEVDVASRAFGTPTNRYADATPANYQGYLSLGASPTLDRKVARELLTAWLNLVSGREPAAQTIDVKAVSGWWTVVTNTGGQNGSSVTTALNLVRESERRLEASPSAALLDTIQILLDRLNTAKLNK